MFRNARYGENGLNLLALYQSNEAVLKCAFVSDI
jgi:hypothetical protein